MSDNVNNPLHYCIGGIETIDFMKAKCSTEQFKGYLACSILKYISRAPYKGRELEDYRKARWYLNKIIAECEIEIENEQKPIAY